MKICLPPVLAAFLPALAALPRLAAQNGDALPSPSARLEQLDATYSATLRRYHAPVMLEYLRDLEKLHQSFILHGRVPEAAQVQAEIEKNKKLSTTTGLVSYDPLKPPPEPEPSAPERTKGGKGVRRFNPDAITLSVSNAINPGPAADTLKQPPTTQALAIGHAEWRVEKIPAGVYEVMLVCSMIATADKMSVQATLGTLTTERKIPASLAGNGPNDFRIFRVGTFSLDEDMANTTLALESSNPAQPCMWVRNVILTHPKPPPGAGKKPPGGPPTDGMPPPREGPPPGKGPPPGGPRPDGPKPDGPPPPGAPPPP